VSKGPCRIEPQMGSFLMMVPPPPPPPKSLHPIGPCGYLQEYPCFFSLDLPSTYGYLAEFPSPNQDSFHRLFFILSFGLCVDVCPFLYDKGPPRLPVFLFPEALPSPRPRNGSASRRFLGPTNLGTLPRDLEVHSSTRTHEGLAVTPLSIGPSVLISPFLPSP